MYKFDVFQDKAFNELKNLINYDLKKNNINLDLDKNFFLNYYNNVDIIFENKEDKEKISCTLNFYNFILDSKSSELFLNVFCFITKEKP